VPPRKCPPWLRGAPGKAWRILSAARCWPC